MTVLATLNIRFEKFTLDKLLSEVERWIEAGLSMSQVELAEPEKAASPQFHKSFSTTSQPMSLCPSESITSGTNCENIQEPSKMNNHVSVIIPSYNSARFLPEAIESVLNQTYPVFEIIVVDDGSTDETKAVCDLYPTIKYIYQSNQGLIEARNTGLHASKGEYLIFFDSDDYLLANAVEAGLNCINAHPEAGFVFGNYVLQSSNPDGSYTTQEIYDNKKEVANYENILAGKLKLQVASVLFQRIAVEFVGGFDPNAKGGEDYNLFLRVAREFPIHFHGQKVLEYRYNGGNMSGKPTYIINTIRAHSLQWSYIQQTGKKEYEIAYECGKQAWIKLFGDRLPYEIIRNVQAGKWIAALGILRLILNYDPKLQLIDREIYEVSERAILSKLRTLPIASSLAYWKQQLAGAPPLLPLPTDRPRGAEQTFRGSTQSFVLSRELTSGLSLLSRQKGVTLFMTLLAAFSTLLYRYTGTEDIIVGSPIVNHDDHSEVFVNAVVLRTDLSGNPSFQKLLGQVRKVFLAAEIHQDVPFEILVEELQQQRDLSYSPLFQVMFALEEDVSLQKIELSSLTASPWVLENNEGKFDLTLFFEQNSNELIGRWVYNTDLFNADTIERMNEHFQILLEGIIADPEQPISELSLLTEKEKLQLLLGWNNTQTEYPQDKCIHHWFEEQVERNPDGIAVVYENQQLTYRELNNRANQLANYLITLGVRPDALVGICVERSLEMIVGILGILKAGGAYVPLDPSNPQDRLEYILKNTQVQILVTQSTLLNILPVCEQVVCLDTDNQTIAQYSQTNPVNSSIQSNNLAYVIYTSGSTGKPKGVLVNHYNIVRLFTATEPWYHFNEKDVWTLFHSFAFDFSVWEIWGALFYGGRIVVVPYLVSRDAEAFYNLLIVEQVTVLNQTPSAFYQLIETDENSKSRERLSLRLVIFGGEALNLSNLQPWFERHGDQLPQLVNMYGITETTVHVTYQPLTLADVKATGSLIGRSIPDLQIYLLDKYRQPVPIGVTGEMYVGGAGVAQGYWQLEELTQERFISNPFSKDPNARLYKSGDLARYLKDGSLEYIGRIDNQVKIRGFRIELGEIEALLSQHPGIDQTVVVVNEDIPSDKRLVAYLVSNQDRKPTITTLRDFLSQKLPSYMIPSAFVILDILPLTSNGKVDRRALPAPDRNSLAIERIALSIPDRNSLAVAFTDALATESSFVAPRTTTEEILAGIWSQVLGVDLLSIYDNFFLLGGHSLLAAKMISRCRQAFSVEMSLHQLFKSPTVADLAVVIDKSQNKKSVLSEYQIIPQRANRDCDLPLSFAQQRLWFLKQLEPESSTYHIPITLRLRGSLNIEVLQQAFTTILARHESLRTHFVVTDGIPLQVIAPPGAFELPLIDLSAHSSSQPEGTLKSLLEQGSRRPFDLTIDLMLRATLIRLSAEEHVLQIVMHHIASDGWSMGVFTRELSELYQAFSSGQPNPLPELPVQYADFAEWQRQWLSGEVLDTQLSYWKQQLDGAPPLLELPTDHPRPPQLSYRGAQLTFQVSKSLTDALKQLSQQTGTTLFMALLAAFNTLLYRYTQQEDIVVGSPIANRNRVELEGLIGFFVNTLVLRTDLSGNPGFRKLLERVRQVTLDAYAHQDVPFEKLVEELQPERNLSHSSLFQVLFVLQNAPTSAQQLADLSIQEEPVKNETAKFDLTLSMSESADGLRGVFEYSTDLFEAATIERMVGHFQTLLEGIVANPNQSIVTLPILTAAEQHQLLVEWNDTQTDYPKDKCIHQLFEEQVKRTPDAIAVVFEDQRLTYQELNNRANQLAHYLQSLGVGPDVLVGICVERSIEMLVGLLGILKAGGAYVPLDPTYPGNRLAYMVEDSQLSVLLTQQSFRDQFAEQTRWVICLNSNWQDIAGESPENLNSAVSPDHLAYVIYTSGSTGRPKGVLVTHKGIPNLAAFQSRACSVNASSRVLQFASSSFDASISEVFMALYSGASLYLASKESLMPGPDLLNLLQEAEITLVTLPPSALAVLPSTELPALQTIIVAGETCPVDIVARWSKHQRFFNAYGPTEFTVCATIAECKDDGNPPPIGRPIDNTQIYILDQNLQPLPVGIPGELYIGGIGLASGYLNRPNLTAEKFISCPFSDDPQARLYKTGDLARYLPDGNIEYLGRVDHQVKIRGFRIELGEIETALSQHPAVQQCVVIAREDEPGDKRLVAYVVTTDPAASDNNDFRQFLQQTLTDYMIPSAFVQLGSLPLTPNGKVDRRALPKPEASDLASTATYVAPRTPLEQQLSDIWAQVLKLEQVGIHDNFFELGGHSLLAVSLFMQIEKIFGKDLPLASLFKAPTVKQLAEILRQEFSTHWSSLVAIQSGGSKRPFFFVHGAGGNVLGFQPLSYYLSLDQPLYGLQAEGLDGNPITRTSIEDMAAHYVKEIRFLQPEGPYCIGGYCAGGIIAYEMAQQFHAQGQKIELLVLLDSVFKIPQFTFQDNLHLHLQKLRNSAFTYLLHFIRKRLDFEIGSRIDNIKRFIYKFYLSRGRLLPLALRSIYIEDNCAQAIRNYVPKTYLGFMTLLCSDELREAFRHERHQLTWEQLVIKGLIIDYVSGGHLDILKEPHVQVLAEKLRFYMELAKTGRLGK